MKKIVFYPGRVSVVFRKGPLGFLRQDPSDEARRIKDDPSMRDRSAPVKEETVRQNALTVVRVRGGDPTDPKELQGEYTLQFGRFKGKSFRWLLENDVGYTLYLIKSHQREEAAGTVMSEGHSKDSLMSFLRYALSFQEINSLLQHEAQKRSVPTPAAEDDQKVGFGARANSTWREVWESRADGYAAFILKRKCAPGTKMDKLQQYLQKRQHLSSSVSSSPVPSTPVPTPSASSAEPMEMEEDVELERAMLSISTATEPTEMPLSTPAPVPELQQPSGLERCSLVSCPRRPFLDMFWSFA